VADLLPAEACSPSPQLPYSPCVPTPLSSLMRQMHADTVHSTAHHAAFSSSSPLLPFHVPLRRLCLLRSAARAAQPPGTHPLHRSIGRRVRRPLCAARRAPLLTHRLCCCAGFQRRPCRAPCPPVLFPAVSLTSPVTACALSSLARPASWHAGGRGTAALPHPLDKTE
jgi:hypothetical protein